MSLRAFYRSKFIVLRVVGGWEAREGQRKERRVEWGKWRVWVGKR